MPDSQNSAELPKQMTGRSALSAVIARREDSADAVARHPDRARERAGAQPERLEELRAQNLARAEGRQRRGGEIDHAGQMDVAGLRSSRLIAAMRLPFSDRP